VEVQPQPPRLLPPRHLRQHLHQPPQLHRVFRPELLWEALSAVIRHALNWTHMLNVLLLGSRRQHRFRRLPLRQRPRLRPRHRPRLHPRNRLPRLLRQHLLRLRPPLHLSKNLISAVRNTRRKSLKQSSPKQISLLRPRHLLLRQHQSLRILRTRKFSKRSVNRNNSAFFAKSARGSKLVTRTSSRSSPSRPS
jgi:hypothetical protein